jgi:hypothetical protein
MNSIIDKYKSSLEAEGSLIIYCRLSPQAKNGGIKEVMGDGALKVRVTSAPEKGKANLELINILSEQFEVPLKSVKIIQGHTSKFKKVSISK